MVAGTIVVVLIVAVAAGAVARLVMHFKERARIAAMTPHERVVHDARNPQAEGVEAAESTLEVATTAYEKDLKAAEAFGRRRHGSNGTLTAWEHEVEGCPDEKLMQLRYAEVCRVCGAGLPAMSEAIYERASRTVRCLSHLRGAL